MLYLTRIVIFAMIVCSFGAYSQEQELLKHDDVKKVMQQIFSQHMDKKQISETILRNSFQIYINQFDPDRVYLLEDEVRPYLRMSARQMRRLMRQYQNDDFSAFEQLNDVIRKAIARSRDYREEMERNPEQFFEKRRVRTDAEWRAAERGRPFAKNVSELKTRMHQDILNFVDAERRRFGDAELHDRHSSLMAMYEGAVRNHENQYLFEDESGHQLIAEQKENLQSMHILKALASSLDSHTSVFDPSEAYEMRVRLEKSFQGVGIMVKQGIDGMVVTSLIPNSPAARSHKIQPNDYLIEIDGRAVDREPINNVIDLLRGKSGSEVSLLLKRAGDNKPFRVNLTREPIVINEGRVETSYEEFGNGIIGKITLHSFYQGNGISSEQDVRNAIRELSKKGNLRGLILDLRENSGGFLSQAVKVAGLFITNGVVVISKYSNGDERFYRDMDGKVAYDGPMVVLTSRLTASAAEIVAQALQDYGVAVVVGDKQTYGKGTIQSQTVTDKGGQTSYFKVTVGKYYTVSGKTPQLQGVKADIVAPSQYSLEDYDNLHEDGQFTHDSIEPAYSDSLRDIDPGLRPWYLRYYMPTLQGQKRIWQEALPKLKRNSEYRLAHNKNYQLLMEGDVDSIDEHATNARQRTYGIDDMQMNEAVNVIKDMIIMESRMPQDTRNLEQGNDLTKGVVYDSAAN